MCSTEHLEGPSCGELLGDPSGLALEQLLPAGLLVAAAAALPPAEARAPRRKPNTVIMGLHP
jgi:hypothetical protein